MKAHFDKDAAARAGQPVTQDFIDSEARKYELRLAEYESGTRPFVILPPWIMIATDEADPITASDAPPTQSEDSPTPT